jgi:hypothetical protein
MAASQMAHGRYVIRAPNGPRSGDVPPASAKSEVLTVCTPAHSGVDVTVTSRSSARILNPPLSFAVTGTRPVGLRLGPISTEAMGKPCKP